MHESVRQRARELAQTPEFAKAQRQRKKVEALFAELKNQIGLRRLRLRRMKFVREQFPGSGGPEHQAIGALPKSLLKIPFTQRVDHSKKRTLRLRFVV